MQAQIKPTSISITLQDETSLKFGGKVRKDGTDGRRGILGYVDDIGPICSVSVMAVHEADDEADERSCAGTA